MAKHLPNFVEQQRHVPSPYQTTKQLATLYSCDVTTFTVERYTNGSARWHRTDNIKFAKLTLLKHDFRTHNLM